MNTILITIIVLSSLTSNGVHATTTYRAYAPESPKIARTASVAPKPEPVCKVLGTSPYSRGTACP